MRTLTCGCVMEALFAANCPTARKLEAQLRQAIREKDWDKMRQVGELLRRHRAEEAAPNVEQMAAPVAKLTG